MKTKNIFVIFSLFIILMCCVSAISAASDDIIDDTVSEVDSGEETISNSNDEQAIGVDSTEPASAAPQNDDEITDGEKLASNEDDSALTKDQTDEVLSYTALAEFYSVKLDSTYQITSNKDGKIPVTVTPPTTAYGYLEYSFMLLVLDSDGNIVTYSDAFTGRATSQTWTISKNTIVPGIYTLQAYNLQDQKLMAEAVLGVKGQAVITSSDFNAYYMSGSKMTATIKDKVTGKPLTSLLVKVEFTNGKTTKTEEYLPDSNGQISFEPPVGVGTWTVKFSSSYDKITGSAVQTATVKKSSVSIRALKITEYQGYKTTLKAIVKSHGRNVKEGTVTFKINGKTYKAAVKNGVATVKVPLTKIRTYSYTAKYNGNANLGSSKTVKSTATLKKSYRTKIIFKNQVVYAGKSRAATILVKTTDGKNVANGKLKVVSGGQTHYAAVKNGKARIYVKGVGTFNHFIGFTKSGETYKGSIVKKSKIIYIPASHKYRASGKTVKVTSKFKCPCGKTTTHYHKAWSGSYYYKHIISVR